MRKTLIGFIGLILTNSGFAQLDLFQKDSVPKQLNEVVITGQYKPQSIKNSVYQTRIINNERIRLRGANNLQQILNSELGFRFSNDNALGTSDVQLMGMSGRNVKILLDGVPMVDRGDTRESLNQIDINSIERIEIVEGPMSVSYGSDALAGVINIITKKISNKKLSITAKAQEETAGNEYYPFSYKGLHQQSITVGTQKSFWNVNMGASHIDFDGFGGDNFGRAKNWKPKEQWLGNIKIGFTNQKWNTYYRLDALDETITARGAINYDILRARDQQFITNRYMHQLQNEWRIDNDIRLNTVVSYTQYNRRTKTTEHNFEKGTDELTTGNGEQDISKFNAAVFRNTLQYAISNFISLLPGIDINYEMAKGERITGKPSITDYAFFISSEVKPTSKINIRPGLRFIKNSVYDAPPVIPSINTKFVLHKNLDFRLAYAYGFRSPALRELYFDFQDANHSIVGNPGLKAENSNSFTGSLSWSKISTKNIHFSSKVAGFYNEFNNLINYASNSNNPSQFILVNIDKFKTSGFTVENNINWKDLQTSFGLSYIGRFNDFSTNDQFKNDNLPTFLWSPEITSTIIYSYNKIATHFSLFYKYTGKRPGYTLATENNQEVVKLTKTTPYHWADFSVSKNICTNLTLSTGLKNIFNVYNILNSTTGGGSVHNNSGAIPIGYGRSYFLSLTFQWNKQ